MVARLIGIRVELAEKTVTYEVVGDVEFPDGAKRIWFLDNCRAATSDEIAANLAERLVA